MNKSQEQSHNTLKRLCSAWKSKIHDHDCLLHPKLEPKGFFSPRLIDSTVLLTLTQVSALWQLQVYHYSKRIVSNEQSVCLFDNVNLQMAIYITEKKLYWQKQRTKKLNQNNPAFKNTFMVEKEDIWKNVFWPDCLFLFIHGGAGMYPKHSILWHSPTIAIFIHEAAKGIFWMYIERLG